MLKWGMANAPAAQREKRDFCVRLVGALLLMALLVRLTPPAVVPGQAPLRHAAQQLRLALEALSQAQSASGLSQLKLHAQRAINVIVGARSREFDAQVAHPGDGHGVQRYLVDVWQTQGTDNVRLFDALSRNGRLEVGFGELTLAVNLALVRLMQVLQAARLAIITRDAAFAREQVDLAKAVLHTVLDQQDEGVRFLQRAFDRAAQLAPPWLATPQPVTAQLASEYR